MKTKQLSIPQPCTQAWSAMQEQEQGKFCAHCQKTVIDFTGYDDVAFIAYFQQAKTLPCGRFTQRQLSIAIPRQPAPLLPPVKLYRYMAAGLLSMVSAPAIAQAQPTQALTVHVSQEANTAATQAPPGTTGTDTVTIKGRVTDLQGIAIPFATVSIQGPGTNIITDIDGHFSFAVTAQQRDKTVLLVGTEGYEIKRVYLADYANDITVALGDPVILGGVEYYAPKPSLWKRVTKPFRKKH